eukprot:TRINITY_DN12111_c0_g1_i1.p1 TRINITY_DN12111_c0_g1~~TRINITY_DN12111_c0_g1_i1.p1  ORF type:complete len:201 (+),score=-27.53 TRINITY_DN12111_c0_g1_i1:58-660(+)
MYQLQLIQSSNLIIISPQQNHPQQQLQFQSTIPTNYHQPISNCKISAINKYTVQKQPLFSKQFPRRQNQKQNYLLQKHHKILPKKKMFGEIFRYFEQISKNINRLVRFKSMNYFQSYQYILNNLLKTLLPSKQKNYQASLNLTKSNDNKNKVYQHINYTFIQQKQQVKRVSKFLCQDAWLGEGQGHVRFCHRCKSYRCRI